MIDVTATDVSGEGAYLLTDEPVEVGQGIRLLLESAPELNDSTMVFRATGVVLRVEEDSPEGKLGFAVKFHENPTMNSD